MAKIRQSKDGTTKVSVKELMDLIPTDYIAELSEQLKVDKWVTKLKADVLCKLLIFSLLKTERNSLRVMERTFEEPFFQASAKIIVNEAVTWTGIRDRLMKLDINFCGKLYDYVYEKVSSQYDQKSLEKYNIKRYDSTMIATFSKLLSGMKVGNSEKGKTQIKLTTGFVNDFGIQIEFHQEQKFLSEERALKKAILDSSHDKHDICVFDKGLSGRKSFRELAQNKVLFISILNENPQYNLLYSNQEDDGISDTEELEFIQDSTVYLFENGRKLVEEKFRLIQYRVKKDGKILSFICNVWDLEPIVIANGYAKRWEIEVLFRFLKQEMNLTHFVCNNKNAIEVMLYFTMITSMLLLVYKKKNKINSYKQAKIQFYDELIFTIYLELLEDPESIIWIKQIIKNRIKKT